MAASDRVKAVVVGSGWGRHAAEALASDARVELAALVGRASPRTEALAQRLDVPALTSVGAAITTHAPQLAVVAAGSKNHQALLEPLIDAGVHVLCTHPVLERACDVGQLAQRARERSALFATDYTLRLCPSWLAAFAALSEIGTLMRTSIRSPSRMLVMALDLAIALAGPVDRVVASARYPKALAERRRRSPAAFGPSALLEHHGGGVSSLMVAPHAAPQRACRVSISGDRGRIDVELPRGDATFVRYLGRGRLEQRMLLRARGRDEPPEELYGGPMRELTARFVSSVLEGSALHAPIEEEVVRRTTWAALVRSAKERRYVDVDARGSSTP